MSKVRRVKESFTRQLLLLCFTLMIGCAQSERSHPSDLALDKQFSAQESDFNKLVAMSNEDSKVVRIAMDFTRLQDNWAWPRPESELGFSKQRWEEYKSLFDKLGLKAGLERYDDSGATKILLTASTFGIVNRGTSKGFAYSEKELSPLFNSLDQNPISQEKRLKHGIVYKKLKTNWYLYLDW